VSELQEETAGDALQEALDTGDSDRVAELLRGHVAPEVAAAIERLADAQDRLRAFRAVDPAQAAEVFAYLPLEDQRAMAGDLDSGALRVILASLGDDDRTLLFSSLEEQEAHRLFDLLEPSDLRRTRDMLAFPESSVGRLMSPQYLSVMTDWSIERALNHFREHGEDSETADMVYVVDPRGRLVDDIPLRRFVMAAPERRVRDIMDGSFVCLVAEDDQERAVELMMDYDLTALPVVDADNHLIGVVTIDDVFDIAEEEATEDIHKASAVVPLGMSYRRAGVFMLFQRRVYWLALLIIVNLVSSGIIAAYEEVLQAAITLAFFIPLLIDSGGNSGSQAATMMVRAIAVGEIEMRDWLRTLAKELGVGVLLGITLAVLASGLGFYRGGAEIGLVVGISMLAIIIFSNVVGMTLPFALQRLGVDPAAASSPLITSVCDAAGLFIYFVVAIQVLNLG
jgi:magnesium transporter